MEYNPEYSGILRQSVNTTYMSMRLLLLPFIPLYSEYCRYSGILEEFPFIPKYTVLLGILGISPFIPKITVMTLKGHISAVDGLYNRMDPYYTGIRVYIE